MRRNEITVYVMLGVAWLLLVGWQAREHRRVVETERNGLRTQAMATSIAIGAAIRSGRPERGGRMIQQERLERILHELSKTSGIESLALLNAKREVVASAGRSATNSLPEASENWNATDGVTFVWPVDFGDPSTTSTTIVMPPFRAGQTSGTLQQGRVPPPEDEEHAPPPAMNPRSGDAHTTAAAAQRDGRREWHGERAGQLSGDEREPPPEMNPHAGDERTTAAASQRDGRRRGGPPPFRRPSRMTAEQYEELGRSRGLHGFVIKLLRADYDRALAADLWQRMIVSLIAALAGAGLGIAWRQVENTTRLQLRLARASQLNLHLQEMNLAAAGLAHETRNPLNIIRGLAQMITQQPCSAEIHSRAEDIEQEVDRVTSRLNEFINYSRPPEPRPAPLNFHAVVMEVVRALDGDMADKAIRFEPDDLDGTIEADQGLLRQMLFNLLLNAVQAVGREGVIRVGLRPDGFGEASFEVRDNGPGIPADQREQIFRPYFTTREGGTGLGLAIVRQIALAHRWEIECLDAQPGACFIVRGVKLVPRAPIHPEAFTPSRR